MESENISVDTEISIYRSSPVHHLDSNLLAPLSPNLDSRYVCVYSLTTATKSSPLTRADGAWWSLVQSGCEWSRNLRPPPTLISTIVTSSQSPVSVQHLSIIWKLLGIFSTAERKNRFFLCNMCSQLRRPLVCILGSGQHRENRGGSLHYYNLQLPRGEARVTHPAHTWMWIVDTYQHKNHTFKLIVINVCFYFWLTFSLTCR